MSNPFGGGSSTQTTTQRNEPPAYLQPYLTEGAREAQRIYRQGPAQYYPGETVVPFAPETERALTGITDRATTGSPVNSAARDSAIRMLGAPSTQFGTAQNPFAFSDNPFGGASNPMLDQAFNQAADKVTNRLQSSFAGSGRNIDAGRPVAADELGSLAAGIYLPAYESERNRQLAYGQQQLGIGATGYEAERDRMATDINQQRQQQLGAMGLAPMIANQDYADLDRLSSVGATREDLTSRQMQDAVSRHDFAQNAPGFSLDQYLTRLQGMPGSTQSATTPIYRNAGAGILGGAQAGSSIGGQFGYPGIGAILGGLLGAF